MARTYHHGNLRRELLDAALDEIRTDGAAGLSLRELARRAGVSHAAPAHHFGDKTGLLTAIAVEGFERLAEALRAGHERGHFIDIGLAYVQFAVDHPAHFEVMWRPDLYRADDADLLAAEAQTSALLYGPAGEEFPDSDTTRVATAGWAFVHGFASLWINGNLKHLGDDPIAAARSAATALFSQP
ncbi:MAG TPA: TetR/AcrR family transcriptional regulator [Acidimicrobiia bacterium]|nr:TetR/AcrR family transcriptional regulator [Acidimicrobiia bacterium]